MDESEASEQDKELTETPEPQDTTDMLRAGLAAISNDIRELKQDLRHQLSTFKDELKKEVKEEINNLRQELYNKLTENQNELQTQKSCVSEAETRIAELEEWQSVANGALLGMSDHTRQMQDRLTDLEGRTRRNNIRIFGVPEDAEGSSAGKYLERLLSIELELSDGPPLQIQSAHRALGQKPPPSAPPRSI